MKLIALILGAYILTICRANERQEVDVAPNGEETLEPELCEGKSETKWVVTSCPDCYLLISCNLKGCSDSCKDANVVLKQGQQKAKLCPSSIDSINAQTFNKGTEVEVSISAVGTESKITCTVYSIESKPAQDCDEAQA